MWTFRVAWNVPNTHTFNQLKIDLRFAKAKSNHQVRYVTDSTLALTELSQTKKNHENKTLTCKGDTSTALILWFHHNLAGFSNSADYFCFFSVISPIAMDLIHCQKLLKLFFLQCLEYDLWKYCIYTSLLETPLVFFTTIFLFLKNIQQKAWS